MQNECKAVLKYTEVHFILFLRDKTHRNTHLKPPTALGQGHALGQGAALGQGHALGRGAALGQGPAASKWFPIASFAYQTKSPERTPTHKINKTVQIRL